MSLSSSQSHLDRWAFGMSKIEGDDAPASFGSPKGDKSAAAGPSSSSSGAKLQKSTSSTSTEDTKGKRADSTELAAERISNVTLDTSPFGEKVRLDSSKNAKAAGPSFLSQQVASHVGGSSSGSGSGGRPSASSSSHAPQQTTSPPPYMSDSTVGSPEDPTAETRPMSVDADATTVMQRAVPILDGTEKITVKIADLGNGEWMRLDASGLVLGLFLPVPVLSIPSNGQTKLFSAMTGTYIYLLAMFSPSELRIYTCDG